MPVNIQITGCSFTWKIIVILISIKYHKNTRIAFITHCTCPWICSFHEDVSKKFAHSIAYIALCFPPLIFFKKSSLELEKKSVFVRKRFKFCVLFCFCGGFFLQKKNILSADVKTAWAKKGYWFLTRYALYILVFFSVQFFISLQGNDIGRV